MILDVTVPGPGAIESGGSWRREFRREVMKLQDAMAAMPGSMGADPYPLKHTFAPGAYAREITLPQGSIVVGKIHKHAHLNFITKGRVRVMTEFGPVEYVAPVSFVSEVGTKRVVYAVEETVWTTVHVTNETDLAKIEDEIIAPTYEALEILALEKDEQ